MNATTDQQRPVLVAGGGPVGVVTALIGVPVFLLLLTRSSS